MGESKKIASGPNKPVLPKKVGIVEVSYEVFHVVAKNMKAPMIQELLVLPAAKILVRKPVWRRGSGKIG